ncbi:hypothetical protein JCM8097_006178 [Rhodosporidiobolus ruineniae]
MSDTEDQPQQPEKQGPGANAAFDIFGGEDSDLTDLEASDKEDAPSASSPARRRSPSPSRSRSRSASAERSASPAAPSDAGEDEYQDEDDDRLRKMGKIAKKKRTGDEAGDEAPAKKKKKKSAKKAQQDAVLDDEPEEEVDPETRRRKELSKRITEIAKKPAGKSKSKKKKAQDEEDLEMLNDELVATLRNQMLNAADRDIEENDLGRPALHKLKLLPQVVELMQKTALADTIVEGGMLEAVKRWLEPLPDRSLPALNIQRPLFNLLRTITIETSALKSSGLGKIVYFYTKCKRVDPAIARVANQLVSDWMRPILRRSKAFVDRDLASGYSGASHAASLAAAQEPPAVASRHARIPQAMTATFLNAPRSGATGGGGSMPGQGSGAKMRSFAKKLQDAKTAAKRV